MNDFNFPSVTPWFPCYGKFDLTTYIQGASDYEIMCNLVQQYNTIANGYNSIINALNELKKVIDSEQIQNALANVTSVNNKEELATKTFADGSLVYCKGSSDYFDGFGGVYIITSDAKNESSIKVTSGYATKLNNAKNEVHNSLMTGASNYSSLKTIGKVILPDGHSVQGCEFCDGYAYIGHHANDEDVFTISKYIYPTLEHISDVVLPAGLHGNSLTVAPNNQLILCDYNTRALYYVDLNTFTYTGKYEYGATHISSLTFNKSMTNCVAISPGGLGLTFFEKLNPESGEWNQCFNSINIAKGNGAAQDASGSDTFIYQLLSTADSSNKYESSAIHIIGWNGSFFKDIYLPSYCGEFEGITRDSDNKKFYLVTRDGTVYEMLANDSIIGGGFFSQAIQNNNLVTSIDWSSTHNRTDTKGTYNITTSINIPRYPRYEIIAQGVIGRLINKIDFSCFGYAYPAKIVGSYGLQINFPLGTVAHVTVRYKLADFNWVFDSVTLEQGSTRTEYTVTSKTPDEIFADIFAKTSYTPRTINFNPLRTNNSRAIEFVYFPETSVEK